MYDFSRPCSVSITFCFFRASFFFVLFPGAGAISINESASLVTHLSILLLPLFPSHPSHYPASRIRARDQTTQGIFAFTTLFSDLFSFLSEHRNGLVPGRGGLVCKASWAFLGHERSIEDSVGRRRRTTTPTTNPPRFPGIGISFKKALSNRRKKTRPSQHRISWQHGFGSFKKKKRSRRQAIIVFLEGIICTLTRRAQLSS